MPTLVAEASEPKKMAPRRGYTAKDMGWPRAATTSWVGASSECVSADLAMKLHLAGLKKIIQHAAIETPMFSADNAVRLFGKVATGEMPATAKDVKRAAKRAKAAARAAERADKAAHAKAAKTSKSKATRESAAGSGTLPAGDEENEGAVRVRLRVASLGVAVATPTSCSVRQTAYSRSRSARREPSTPAFCRYGHCRPMRV